LHAELAELQKEYLIDMEDVVVVTKNDQDKKDELCNFLEQA
jgi:uncharacterized membrane protein